jgi:WD40 repeat protein
MLWRDDVLGELRRWRRHTSDEGLTALELSFAVASEEAHATRVAAARAEHARRQRLAMGAAIVSTGAALAILGLAIVAWNRTGVAEEALLESRERLITAYLAAGDAAVEQGDQLSALPYYAHLLQLVEGVEPGRAELARVRLAALVQELPTLRDVVVRPDALAIDLAVSPDGDRIALVGGEAGSSKKSLLVGEIGGAWRSVPLGATGLGAAAWSPDGRRIAVTVAGAVRVYAADTLELATPELATPGRSGYFAWDAHTWELLDDLPEVDDGEWLCFVSADRRVAAACRPAPRHKERRTFLSAAPDVSLTLSEALSPTAELLIERQAPGSLGVRTLDGRLLHGGIGVGEKVDTAEFGPDGRWLAPMGVSGRTRVWDAEAGVPLSPHLTRTSARASIGIRESAGVAAVVDQTTPAIRVWSGLGARPGQHATDLLDAAFSTADGSRQIVAHDEQVHILDARGKPVAGPIPGIGPELSADGTYIAIDTRAATAFHRVADGQHLWTLPQRHAAWSPRGHRIVRATGSVVEIYDGETGELVHEFPHTTRRASWIDDRRLALHVQPSGGIVWDIESGTASPNVHGDSWFFTLSPDGSRFVSGCDVEPRAPQAPVLCLYDASGTRAAGPFTLDAHPTGAMFSPDGSKLLMVTASGDAAVLDLSSGALVGFELGGRLQYGPSGFTPDGRFAVAWTSGDVPALTVHDAQTGERVAWRTHVAAADIRLLPDGTLDLPWLAQRDWTVEQWVVVAEAYSGLRVDGSGVRELDAEEWRAVFERMPPVGDPDAPASH